MIHDVSRLDYRLQRTTYRLQKMTQICWKMTKICCFLQINKDSLNPFKCSEMILNYNGKMIDQVNRMEGDLQTTEDDLQTKENDLDITEDGQNLLFPFNYQGLTETI